MPQRPQEGRLPRVVLTYYRRVATHRQEAIPQRILRRLHDARERDAFNSHWTILKWDEGLTQKALPSPGTPTSAK